MFHCAANHPRPTRLDTVSQIRHIQAPTEVDHYQLRRVMDVYVSPSGEDIGKVLSGVQKIIQSTKLPENVRVTVRGSAQAWKCRSAASAWG